jgi:integrase
MARRKDEARLYKRPGSRAWWTWGKYSDGTKWSASTGCRDRGAAAVVAARLERERSSVDRVESQGYPLEQAWRDVITARGIEGKAPGTIDVYRRIAFHTCTVWGPTRDINSLTLADLEQYISARLAVPTKRSTIAMELGKVHALLTYAARRGHYRGDIKALWPGEALRGAYKPRERYLTRDEFAKLHAEVESYGRGDWLIGYVYTGARRRELSLVLPEHIDLARGTLRLRGTKTEGADRVIPIADALRPVVERRLAACEGGPLWPYWHPIKALRNACKRAGIATVVPNDLRRTFCSWLAQAGVPEGACVALMGHKSARMVRTVYARFGSDDLASAIRRL